MKAKELFENLGYTATEHTLGVEYRKKDDHITFDKKRQIVYIGAYYINGKTVKAINKQVEEFGW